MTRGGLVGILFVLGACGSTTGASTDAAVADAASGDAAEPDASAPDAAPSTPDAAPGTPDAAPVDGCVQQTWYVDCDDDGYAPSGAMTMQACVEPSPATCGGGWVLTAPSDTNTTDCDDDCVTCKPGGTEICDGFDQDCVAGVDNGVQNTYYRDFDNDGYGDPSSPTQACSVPIGYVTNNGDCNDTSNGGSIHPGATEICFNGVDDDCDSPSLQDEAAECFIDCNWANSTRWLSHGWDGNCAFPQSGGSGAWLTCNSSGKLAYVYWVTGSCGTLYTPNSSGTGDPKVGCNWSGNSWISQGVDGPGAFTYGATASCSSSRVTQMTWASNFTATGTNRTGQLSCNWTGARFLSYGIDNCGAFERGVEITCYGGHITHMREILDRTPGC